MSWWSGSNSRVHAQQEQTPVLSPSKTNKCDYTIDIITSIRKSDISKLEAGCDGMLVVPNTWEAQTGGSLEHRRVQDHPEQHSKSLFQKN